MKLARFLNPEHSFIPRLGIVRPGGLVDVEKVAHVLRRPVPAADVKAALCSGRATLDALEFLAVEAETRGLFVDGNSVRYLPPVPDPSKFLCIGKNSGAHREELIAEGMLKERPEEPTGFIKLTENMVGQDAEVVRPAGISTLDYEPELAFVVGMQASGVAKADALKHVVALTVFNDLTAREIQKREVTSGTRFWTAKNMPGFAPIGPFCVTLDEIADPFDLWLTCHVNGTPRLRENTSQYIYRIDDVLEHFSRHMPINAGDIIAMGSPKGVAMGNPNAQELYLRPGDAVEVGIEGLMSLRTKIVAPPEPA